MRSTSSKTLKRNKFARALESPLFRRRVVPDKKKQKAKNFCRKK